MDHISLSNEQISSLKSNGCTCADWARVRVTPGFDPARMRNTVFAGDVTIGSVEGRIVSGGTDKPCGIYNAVLNNCCIGSNVRISNVAVHISNYHIADDVCIEDVGTIEASPDAAFGNGVHVNAVNEAGRREVVIFNELSAQFAYLMCLHRHRPDFIEKLNRIALDYADSQRVGHGTISTGASISFVRRIVDTNIGPNAVVSGTSKLINGTILSSPQAPSFVGDDVIARDFIIAEGAVVDDAADIDRVFVGQGTRISKSFSAQDCMFFANCECLNGEAVSVLAGPYTVSHHKSTLLIAGLFSFFNAGSGTDHSNHMYRLGPVHEGKLERGCKCGSSSHMFWPCRIGPFTVILGKHPNNIDVGDFPFSRIMPGTNFSTSVTPAIMLIKVGTIRDSLKWPSRDKRTCLNKRDIINFDMLSPYTVGRMLVALKRLNVLLDTDADEYSVGGAMLKKYDAKNAVDLYESAVKRYLLEMLFQKASQSINSGLAKKDWFALAPDAVYDPYWIDLAGQMMPAARLNEIYGLVVSGDIDSVEKFSDYMSSVNNSYDNDQWGWVVNTYQDFFGKSVSDLSMKEIAGAADDLIKLNTELTAILIKDAASEYSDISMIGFGMDGTDAGADFQQVRGCFAENSFVKMLNEKLQRLQTDVEQFKVKASSIVD